MADVQIKGLAELQTFMDQLPAKLEANVMRGALRAGMKTVQTEAQKNLYQSGTAKTYELMAGLKVSTRIKNGTVMARLRASGKHAFVAYWMEFTGAKPHDIKPKRRKSLFIAGMFGEIVHHPGFRPRPFMRPALDGQSQNAVVAAAEYIKNRLATKNGLDTADIEIEVES